MHRTTKMYFFKQTIMAVTKSADKLFKTRMIIIRKNQIFRVNKCTCTYFVL